MHDILNMAYISLGSNLGDRQQYLQSAIEQLHADERLQVERCSSIYETAPVGYTDQPNFLNMVIAVRTSYDPLSLLHLLLETERHMGRVRTIRYGPRTIDLDLLMYEQEQSQTEELELPHPRMLERAFVLIPLQEIISDEWLTQHESLRTAMELVDGKGEVKLWARSNWRSESGRFES